MKTLLAGDVELEALTLRTPEQRDGWISRRIAELTERGITADVSLEARAVLERHHNRYTWTGDLRG